ncbi:MULTISPECIES: sugar phosphate isomerase/epimerase family protein [unclassified Nocardioides]|uniref:sugar phosphate isomerase/epimerase family protein n=1 Tax=unclassified Nocardioides TaxID=2615069 RepID=UPI00360AACCE
MTPLERLSLNTATTKRWTLEQAVEGAMRAGLQSVGVWRDRVAEHGLEASARLLRDHGLRVSSLCRGGFLTASADDEIAAALDDNRAAIEEAATLGAEALVMVVGGLPPGDRDLAAARRRIADRLDVLVPEAAASGVRLALEPLHPMYVADRAVLSTLGQALDLASPYPAASVGVVVDTFHVFWDPDLPTALERAGREQRIASYQVCDFNLPIAADALLSRGIMGDGVVDLPAITRLVHATGYAGDVEVEIFNQQVWDTDPDAVVARVAERYAELVAPALS